MYVFLWQISGSQTCQGGGGVECRTLRLLFIFSDCSGELESNDGVSCSIYLFLLFSSKANTNMRRLDAHDAARITDREAVLPHHIFILCFFLLFFLPFFFTSYIIFSFFLADTHTHTQAVRCDWECVLGQNKGIVALT